MNKILTFGEPLLINYLSESKLVSSCESYFSLGGSEINTSVALSKLGNEVYLVSIFPDNNLGNEFIDILISKKINVKYVIKSDDNLIGSMYVKNNKVIYQRQHSSFYNCKNVNLESIFKIKYNWVHLTGITPSLNDKCKAEWLNILNKSIFLNIPVSIDLNYRPTLCELPYLWNIVKPYVNKLNLFVLSKNDLKDLCILENINVNKNIEDLMLYFCKKFEVKRLVICIKNVLLNKSQDRYSLMVCNNQLYKSSLKNHTPIEHIGGGDAYIGSLIDGILKWKANILDDADNFTIEFQNYKGNFCK